MALAAGLPVEVGRTGRGGTLLVVHVVDRHCVVADEGYLHRRQRSVDRLRGQREESHRGLFFRLRLEVQLPEPLHVRSCEGRLMMTRITTARIITGMTLTGALLALGCHSSK